MAAPAPCGYFCNANLQKTKMGILKSIKMLFEKMQKTDKNHN